MAVKAPWTRLDIRLSNGHNVTSLCGARAMSSGHREAVTMSHNHDMTSDERAQLVEDIKKSDNLRRGIVERAELSEEFDISAAWEAVEKLDESIGKRIVAARKNP